MTCLDFLLSGQRLVAVLHDVANTPLGLPIGAIRKERDDVAAWTARGV
jgi:hypothetical protein